MRGKRIEDKIDSMSVNLARLDASIVVRDPATPYAAEVFDGLRKSITFASQQQRAHIATLLGLLDDVAAGASIEAIELRIRDRLVEAGVQEIRDPLQAPEAFHDAPPPTSPRAAWVLMQNDGSAVVVRPGLRDPDAHPLERTENPESTDDSPSERLADPSAADLGDAKDWSEARSDEGGATP